MRRLFSRRTRRARHAFRPGRQRHLFFLFCVLARGTNESEWSATTLVLKAKELTIANHSVLCCFQAVIDHRIGSERNAFPSMDLVRSKNPRGLFASRRTAAGKLKVPPSSSREVAKGHELLRHTDVIEAIVITPLVIS
jgi:hypothetical protein